MKKISEHFFSIFEEGQERSPLFLPLHIWTTFYKIVEVAKGKSYGIIFASFFELWPNENFQYKIVSGSLLKTSRELIQN